MSLSLKWADIKISSNVGAGVISMDVFDKNIKMMNHKNQINIFLILFYSFYYTYYLSRFA